VSVNWIQVAIHWLVDHQWLCVVVFDISESIVFEEVLKEEEKRKKKINEKKKRKKS